MARYLYWWTKLVYEEFIHFSILCVLWALSCAVVVVNIERNNKPFIHHIPNSSSIDQTPNPHLHQFRNHLFQIPWPHNNRLRDRANRPREKRPRPKIETYKLRIIHQNKKANFVIKNQEVE